MLQNTLEGGRKRSTLCGLAIQPPRGCDRVAAAASGDDLFYGNADVVAETSEGSVAGEL